MQKEAEVHASEDKSRKELVEARNIADNMCYAAEKALRDGGDKVPADVKTDVESRVKNLREIQPTADTSTLKQKTDELSQAMQRIGQAMYGSSGQGPKDSDSGPQGGPRSGPGGSDSGNGSQGSSDNVKEGEVVEE